MLLSKEAEIGLASHNIEHYEKLGYKITRVIADHGTYRVKHGAKIIVSTTDLPIGSHANVKVECDECREILLMEYRNYLKHVKEDGKYSCNQCANISQGKTYYNTERYKIKLEEMGNSIKLEESAEFINSKTKVFHICPICQLEWNIAPGDVLNGHKMCNKCNTDKQESLMATTLKQVLRHHYLKTEWEYDLGFRGFKNGISKYDIFVPEINTAIECQSRYHDTAEQKSIDNKKREYATSNGYKYVSIDSRNHTPLQSIQIFFPDIKEIPNYVDVKEYTIKNYKYEQVQELLDNGCTYREISDVLNVKHAYIRQIIHRGGLSRPEGHHRSNYNKIVCINTKEIFYSAVEASARYMVNSSGVIKCCKGMRRSAGKHPVTREPLKWMYYNEYYELSQDII